MTSDEPLSVPDLSVPVSDDDGTQAGRARPSRVSGWLRLGLVVGSAVVVLIGTGLAFALTKPAVSYQDRVPEKTVLTALVERRVLVAAVITRGSVGSVGDVPVDCYPSSVDAAVRVFTRPAEVGKELREGDLLAAVNGRPVLLLSGDTPAFRDILPGSSGVDVEQLQAALKRLGYKITDKKGSYGESTQRAVKEWYGVVGYTENGPTADQAAQLRAAEDAVDDSEQSVSSAAAAIKEAKKGPSKSERMAAEYSIAEAEQQVRDATSASEKKRAKQQLKLARAQYDEMLAKPDLTELEATRTAAKKALTRAQDDLAALRATTGVSVPYCEVVFLPSLPATVTEATTSQTSDADGVGTNPAGQDDGQGAAAGWATLAPGALILQSQLSATDADLVSKGATVHFRADSSTTERTGTISDIHDTDNGVVVDIKPEEPFTEEERGTDLRVSIEVESTSEAVLAVPVAGITGTADGLARVMKQTTDGPVEVKVRAGLTADGYVEIEPVDAATLTEGDSIVVG